MMRIDKDLMSIQEVRNLIQKAKEAQKILATFSQEEIDKIVKAMAEEGCGQPAGLPK
jgi:acetaldehyde dehydrogenase (acetylating)